MSMSFETIRACTGVPKRRLQGARVRNYQVAIAPAMVVLGERGDDVVGCRSDVTEKLANGRAPDVAMAGLA